MDSLLMRTCSSIWVGDDGVTGVEGMSRPYFVSAQVLDSSRSRGMTRGAGEMGGDGGGCEKMDM